mmetsp:Transcript_59279/g.157791  ORF Transcript_59279/g.157791 Transcript_59279/m.157791 type:complete len:266 (-) Transcript_59279:3628-4425(-)
MFPLPGIICVEIPGKTLGEEALWMAPAQDAVAIAGIVFFDGPGALFRETSPMRVPLSGSLPESLLIGTVSCASFRWPLCVTDSATQDMSMAGSQLSALCSRSASTHLLLGGGLVCLCVATRATSSTCSDLWLSDKLSSLGIVPKTDEIPTFSTTFSERDMGTGTFAGPSPLFDTTPSANVLRETSHVSWLSGAIKIDSEATESLAFSSTQTLTSAAPGTSPPPRFETTPGTVLLREILNFRRISSEGSLSSAEAPTKRSVPCKMG